MKKKLALLLVCIYLLTAGILITRSMFALYQFEHERNAMGQDLLLGTE